ncbi:MAG: hypothetical protein LUG12_08165 [Erysipelotrichaceae bacterium]|nr:hypothetical protein [Erysipelotrichaceae bacterium]
MEENIIKLENTPKFLGITIKGDYDDLNELYDAVSQPTDLYFTFMFIALKERYYDYAQNCD